VGSGPSSKVSATCPGSPWPANRLKNRRRIGPKPVIPGPACAIASPAQAAPRQTAPRRKIGVVADDLVNVRSRESRPSAVSAGPVQRRTVCDGRTELRPGTRARLSANPKPDTRVTVPTQCGMTWDHGRCTIGRLGSDVKSRR
jgi:hypothetical protein